MTVLLDTHAFAWAATAPERLSAAARARIVDASERLLVSAVTPWEISIKHRAGRWPEMAMLLQQFDSVARRLGVVELPLSSDHALAAGGLEWHHADPFDRALAAQALREGVPLITRDAAFSSLPGLAVIW